jgi:hypothetical protein
VEEQGAEDQDGQGEEKERDLFPWGFLAAFLHQVVAPFAGLDAAVVSGQIIHSTPLPEG